MNILLLLYLLICSCYSDLLDIIKKVNYQKQSQWSVIGSVCRQGKQQSPINIHTSLVNQYSNKTFNLIFKDAAVKVRPSINNDLRAKYDKSKIHLILDNHINLRYTSKEYLFHAPSEHTINGHHVDLEFEIIYELDKDFKQFTKNKYAVVSFLFRQVHDTWPHSTIFHDLDLVSNTNVNLGTSLGRIASQLYFFNYQGSLSTPLCDENVDRYVSAKIFQIKESEFKEIRSKINQQNPNNRLIQKLYGRKIFRIKNTLLTRFNKIQSILKRPSTLFLHRKTASITPNFNSLILPTNLQSHPLTHKTNLFNHINHIQQSENLQKNNLNELPTSYNWQYHIRKAIHEDPNLKVPKLSDQFYVGQHPALDANKIYSLPKVNQGLYLENSKHIQQD